eukprot:GEMP01107091.1.p1 GENE.GEMP01107091.1~~GEMP01107091.1.p1  ORF type:complete len:126 (+),score=27.89 GEMP01107091.1:60-437(+)
MLDNPFSISPLNPKVRSQHTLEKDAGSLDDVKTAVALSASLGRSAKTLKSRVIAGDISKGTYDFETSPIAQATFLKPSSEVDRKVLDLRRKVQQKEAELRQLRDEKNDEIDKLKIALQQREVLMI